jgi:hypothetical protein
MRRGRAGFAWVSMMDLLFGMFGALVAMTVIISLKLGSFEGINQRPFHALTVELSTLDDDVARALQRMHVAFLVYTPESAQDLDNEPRCTLAAGREDVSGCLSELTPAIEGASMTEFATASTLVPGNGRIVLSATMLINEPSESGAIDRVVVRPVLADVAALLDLPDQLDETGRLILRLSAKTSTAFWEPRPIMLDVTKLLERAERQPMVGADLLTPTDALCAAASDAESCDGAHILIEGGRLEFSW